MDQRWRLFGGLILGFAIWAGAYALVFYFNLGTPTNSSRWCFEINQKKREAATRIHSRKLLLVGGSGTHFGINAKAIASQTGWPAVNLGTHGILGASYMLDQVRGIAQPGDIILLAFEYELYSTGKLDPSNADKGFVDYIVARDPAYFRALSLKEKWNLFMLTSTQRLKKGLRNRGRPEGPEGDNGIYTSGLMNECGDQIGATRARRAPDALPRILERKASLAAGWPSSPSGLEPIASFCRWAEARHIRVLATYPNLCDQPAYHLAAPQDAAMRIRDFFRDLRVPVLGSYTDALLPPDDFFDSMYHPTEEACLRRTQRFLTELQPFLK